MFKSHFNYFKYQQPVVKIYGTILSIWFTVTNRFVWLLFELKCLHNVNCYHSYSWESNHLIGKEVLIALRIDTDIEQEKVGVANRPVFISLNNYYLRKNIALTENNSWVADFLNDGDSSLTFEWYFEYVVRMLIHTDANPINKRTYQLVLLQKRLFFTNIFLMIQKWKHA